MGPTHKDDGDSSKDEFQTIPHRSSDKLNAYLKQNYNDSLDLNMGNIMKELPTKNFDFIAPENDNVQIREAHDKFIEYLRMRAGAASNHDVGVESIKKRLSSQSFDFVDSKEDKHVEEAHQKFMWYLKDKASESSPDPDETTKS